MARALTLRDEASSLAESRRSRLLLRWMLFLATYALILGSRIYQAPSLAANLLALGFLFTNIFLYAFWDEFIAKPHAETLLAIVDTLFVSVSILLAGVPPAEMFVLTFLVVFMVAFGKTMRQIVVAAAAVAFLYVWMTAQLRPSGMVLHPAFLIRIPFLYSVALYFGYVATRLNIERSMEAQKERTELRTLMDVIEAINTSLDLHQVMLTISTRLSQALKLERCSVLLVDGEDQRSIVLAASDQPELDRLQVDLTKYPEIRQAVETKESVVIHDVRSHPLMNEVRDSMSGGRFDSILVVPMVHRGDLVGILLLRACSEEARFTPGTISFCEAIADASANALKHALLYRRVREESIGHRATIEKLQNVLQHSMDLIVTTDYDGRITDFNRTAENFLGYRKEEIVGLPLTEIYHEAGDRAQFLSELRGSGEIDVPGALMDARDGSKRAFDLNVSVIRNELGEVVGSVCVGKRTYAQN